MTKRVHDVVASELDFIRLTERLGTERQMARYDGEFAAQDDAGSVAYPVVTREDKVTDMDPATSLELDLRLSLFRSGFAYGVREMASRTMPHERNAHSNMNDADYSAGYSAGSCAAEQALETYRAALEGR